MYADVMKPIKRKLRGALRVVDLQAAVVRLHAVACAFDEAAGPDEAFAREAAPALYMAHDRQRRDAYDALRRALLDLYGVSPKRALALAVKIGWVEPDWFTRMGGKEGPFRFRVRGTCYNSYRKHRPTLEVAGLRVGDAKTQRKLKKMVAKKARSA